MVSLRQRIPGMTTVVIGAACLLLAAGDARAAVVANVDREDVELNESFTLKITVDTEIDAEPDASALQQDFYVGQRSHLSNTTIVNGQISRSRTWNYVLMAKRTGELTIPPVVIGKEQSQPVSITVKPTSSAAPGEADVFVTAEVDNSEGYVQAQLLYRVKLYRAVPTRQPRLSEPDLGGVDVLVEPAGDERLYDAVLNGRSYDVVERVYALFPQESGELTIGPTLFEARVLRDGRITGRKVFQTEAQRITVNPIPSPPADHPDAAWLPAKSVELSEEWSREPDRLPAGEPITRRITVTALGQLSTQIPVIEPASLDAIKVYPDRPELSVSAVSGGILAERRDQYAIIGAAAGPVELPAVELPWFDIESGEWQLARLPERPLTILPPAHTPVPTPAPQDSPALETTTVVESAFWRRISEALAVVWLLTLCAWWWARRPRRIEPAEPPQLPLHKQQARSLKRARKAAQANDTAGVKSALLEWGRLQWPDDVPRSLGALATRVSEPLATELERLCSQTYGPAAGDGWSGQALAKSLRSFSVKEAPAGRADIDRLPPLMPGRLYQ